VDSETALACALAAWPFIFLGGYLAGVLLRDLRWRDAGDEGTVVESGGRRWLVVPVEVTDETEPD
jgi:hypothetical protein